MINIFTLTEAQSKRLEEIIVLHTRLALEHIQPNTTTERKQDIKKQIQDLRDERKSIIGE